MLRSPNEPATATPISSWGEDIPRIPPSRGVFWPTMAIGFICTLVGLYLVVTPAPEFEPRKQFTPLPDPIPARSPQSQAEVVPGQLTLRCAFVDSADSSFALGVADMAENVRKLTNGEITIVAYPDGLIDGRKMGERSLVDAVRSGEIEMALCTTSPLTNFHHHLDVFDLPFLFTDHQHADLVLDGEVGQQLLEVLLDKNLVGLGYFGVGFRIISSSTPLPDFASFQDKKIRVMESVTFNRFIRAIGGEPVPSPVDKIYLMGKEGYIDGADRTYPTYWDFQLYDVHRFITETNHAYSVKMVLINSEVFESLSEEQRSILRQATREASRFQRRKQREADLEVKQMALKEGIKVFDLGPEDRERFLEASSELLHEYRLNQSAAILRSIQNLAPTASP